MLPESGEKYAPFTTENSQDHYLTNMSVDLDERGQQMDFFPVGQIIMNYKLQCFRSEGTV